MADPLTLQEETALVLRAIVAVLLRFIVITKAQAAVIALWVAHTYVVAAADQTPYLHIRSPEKRCAKTLLLELLELLSASGLRVSNVSTAALFRFIEATGEPTLLSDEVDATWSGRDEKSEELRGIYNAGNRRGGSVLRCENHGASVKRFSVFGPKAFAGIGDLPETMADRSIPIRMRRKLPTEHVERFRRRDVEAHAQTVVEQLEAWAPRALEALRDAEPALPHALNDRQQDAVEPLLAIADLADGTWGEFARTWLLELLAESEDTSVESIEQRCLRDCREVLDVAGMQPIVMSEDVVSWLRFLPDSPWSTIGGMGLSANYLARLLKGYGITPSKYRFVIDGETVQRRGYVVDDFRDTWARFLDAGTDASENGGV